MTVENLPLGAGLVFHIFYPCFNLKHPGSISIGKERVREVSPLLCVSLGVFVLTPS